jgi:hypothetical protein
MHRVTYKLGNMRKPQNFMVTKTDKGNFLVQSDKSIGMFNSEGKGLLNTKGCYFPYLSRQAGAIPFTFPTEFVAACMIAFAEPGELIGTSPITGPVYYAGTREI